jgi:hypothetical protein
MGIKATQIYTKALIPGKAIWNSSGNKITGKRKRPLSDCFEGVT